MQFTFELMDEPIGVLIRDIQSRLHSHIAEVGEHNVPEIISLGAKLASDIIRELKVLKELAQMANIKGCQMELIDVLNSYLSERSIKLSVNVKISGEEIKSTWKKMQAIEQEMRSLFEN